MPRGRPSLRRPAHDDNDNGCRPPRRAPRSQRPPHRGRPRPPRLRRRGYGWHEEDLDAGLFGGSARVEARGRRRERRRAVSALETGRRGRRGLWRRKLRRRRLRGPLRRRRLRHFRRSSRRDARYSLRPRATGRALRRRRRPGPPHPRRRPRGLAASHTPRVRVPFPRRLGLHEPRPRDHRVVDLRLLPPGPGRRPLAPLARLLARRLRDPPVEQRRLWRAPFLRRQRRPRSLRRRPAAALRMSDERPP
mmetsp:Transcript_173/g.492  ORF Transcript_173/g.492 Transcript_173/m.492 type:complete len:249 (-) Transcript_173:41-787(-)